MAVQRWICAIYKHTLFILKLYEAIKSTLLDTLRYTMHSRSISQSSVSSGFKLASLKPTATYTKFQSYRAYLAVKQWMVNIIIVSNWSAVAIEGRDCKPIHFRSISSPTGELRIVPCGARQVVWRHTGVERHGCIVHQCAVAVIDENAATLPHYPAFKIGRWPIEMLTRQLLPCKSFEHC